MVVYGQTWAKNFALRSNVMCSYVDVDVDVYKEEKFIPQSSTAAASAAAAAAALEEVREKGAVVAYLSVLFPIHSTFLLPDITQCTHL